MIKAIKDAKREQTDTLSSLDRATCERKVAIELHDQLSVKNADLKQHLKEHEKDNHLSQQLID